MHVKVYAVRDEERPDRWQVLIERSCGCDFQLASGLTRKVALAAIRIAERTATQCGAVVGCA